MAKKIKVDYDLCQSVGMCESIAPQYFAIDDKGYQQVKQETVSDGDLETVQEAVDSCPTGALSLVED